MLSLVCLWLVSINFNMNWKFYFCICKALNKIECPLRKFNNKQIPLLQSTKYLGITIDKRLTWLNHTKQKRKQLNSCLHRLNLYLNLTWVLKTNYCYTKLLSGQYGHMALKFGFQPNPQTFPLSKPFNQLPWLIAPWYITNSALINDLKIQTVNGLSKNHYNSFYSILNYHINHLTKNMF